MFRNIGNNYALRKAEQNIGAETSVATTKGIGIKTIMLVGLTFISALLAIAFITANNFNNLADARVLITYIVCGIATFVLQIIICFSPLKAKYLSIPYAIVEGLSLGVLVGILEFALPGEGLQIAGLALIVTVAMFFAATILYTTGIIKVGAFFRGFMMTVLTGVVIVSLIGFIVWIFSPATMAMYYSSPLAIGIGVIMVIISSLYVVISLDNAAKMVQMGLDKRYEWLASYGILINIVWLFLEVLRLLMRLANSRK